MNIPILYEDNDFLVINKPAGLVVHADGKTKEPNLVEWLTERYPAIKEVGEHIELANGDKIFKSGIVHRIDRETTGVLLVAKNQEAYMHAKEQFQERTTKKTYLTFVYGSLKEDKGKIDRPIGRSKSDFRKWTAQRGSRGEMRDAVTEYSVLDRGEDGGEKVSYVEARPLTGRTHQIRVHFKAINYPVVGDSLYAENKKPILGFSRLALHAATLEFELLGGKRAKVEAPLPDDFKKALNMLKRA